MGLSSYDRLEAVVSLLHIESQIMRLIFVQLRAALHLVERNEPLYDLATMVKVLVCNFVDGLYDIGQKRVQGGFRYHVKSEGIEEGDEVLSCSEDQTAGCCRWWYGASRCNSCDEDLICC